MNIADIVVAELRELIELAIPQIIHFLIRVFDDNLRWPAAKILLNLSQEGCKSCFLA
jgi:hypothetical protein